MTPERFRAEGGTWEPRSGRNASRKCVSLRLKRVADQDGQHNPGASEFVSVDQTCGHGGTRGLEEALKCTSLVVGRVCRAVGVCGYVHCGHVLL